MKSQQSVYHDVYDDNSNKFNCLARWPRMKKCPCRAFERRFRNYRSMAVGVISVIINCRKYEEISENLLIVFLKYY